MRRKRRRTEIQKNRLGHGNDYIDISFTNGSKTELLDYEVDLDGVRLHGSPVPME
jgi:hypothetical protein